MLASHGDTVGDSFSQPLSCTVNTPRLCDLPRGENSSCRPPLPWSSGHRTRLLDKSPKRPRLQDGEDGLPSLEDPLSVSTQGPPRQVLELLAGRDRKPTGTDFPNSWFSETTRWGHTLALREMPRAAWVGAGILALRSFPEVSLVLGWLVHTPRALHNLYRLGSRYQSRQADSAKLSYFRTPNNLVAPNTQCQEQVLRSPFRFSAEGKGGGTPLPQLPHLPSQPSPALPMPPLYFLSAPERDTCWSKAHNVEPSDG